jgi:hypothetical protein
VNSRVSIANMAGVTLATYPYEIGKSYSITDLKAGTYFVSIQQQNKSMKKHILGTQLLLIMK